MPAEITCPNCQATYQIPEDQHGKKVCCATCQAIFVAGGVEPILEVLPAGPTATIPQRIRKKKAPARSLGPIAVLLVIFGVLGTVLVVTGSFLFLIWQWQRLADKQQLAAREIARANRVAMGGVGGGGVVQFPAPVDPLPDEDADLKSAKADVREVALAPVPDLKELASAPVCDKMPAHLAVKHQAGRKDMTLFTWIDLRSPGKGDGMPLIGRTATLFTESILAVDTQEEALLRLQYRAYSQEVQSDKPAPKPVDIASLAVAYRLDRFGNPLGQHCDPSRLPEASRQELLAIHERQRLVWECLAIPLPNRRVQPEETWQATRSFPVHMLGSWLEQAVLEQTYTYRGIRRRNNQDEAILTVTGSLKGRRGREAVVKGRVEGVIAIDLDRGEAVLASLVFHLDLDLSQEEQPLQASGTIAVRLQRTLPPREPE